MALDTFIDTEQTIKRTRRIFAPEFKQHLVELCQQPDTSVAKVAMQHQVNAPCIKNPIHSTDRLSSRHSSPGSSQTRSTSATCAGEESCRSYQNSTASGTMFRKRSGDRNRMACGVSN